MDKRMPESMVLELGAWNNGTGIDLESWTGCKGNFRLAVGYSTVFWPQFEGMGRYILRKGGPSESLISFERQQGATTQSVEAVLNHLHIADSQHAFCADISRDKLIWLGVRLKEIYAAKLAWQFPDTPCVGEFYRPDDPDDLTGYQISFWQGAPGALS